VALVTGAGQGVGAGIARALAARGDAVAVNDLHEERAAAVAGELVAAGGRASAVAFDVRDARAVGSAVAEVEATWGPVEVLVNNAGVPAEGFPLAPFRELDPDLWARFVDLNLYGSLHCIRAVLDGMCERGWGRIVQISSGAAHVGTTLGISLYGAAKAGVEGFVRHLAVEVARDGVTANCVALGLMDNVAGASEEGEQLAGAMARAIPVGRLGSAGDAAAAVSYLTSEEASWITGQTLHVNGGALG
jgi:3-oxoacyl-[acyl-carrier protein] reductase